MLPRLLVTPQFIQFSPGWQLSFANNNKNSNNNSNNYNQFLVCQQRSQMKVSFCWVCWPQLSMIIKIKYAGRIACKSTATVQHCNVQRATRRHCSTFTSIVSCICIFFSLSNFNLNCLCCMQTMPSFIFIECQLPMDVAATVAALALLHCCTARLAANCVHFHL